MDCEVIRSRRKTLSAQIREGRLVVRAPLRTTDAEIRAFLEKHRRWLEKHLQQSRALEQAKAGTRKLTKQEIAELKKKARAVIPGRVAYYAPLVGVSYGRITIRNQRTRWGSCSAKGNLNFNYQLYYLPEELMDYVIIHELAHRKHMNHSKEFWKVVEEYCPDYRERRKVLKGFVLVG